MHTCKPAGFILLTLIIVLLCGTALAAEFTADLRITQQGESIIIKLYVRDHLYRVEKLEGDDKFLAIENTKTDVTTAMNPVDKTYKELEGSSGAFANPVKGWGYMIESAEEKLVGTETVGGFECDHYTYAYSGQDDPALEQWKSKKLDHFIKYVVHYGGDNGDGVMEVLNIVEGPVDDAMFKVPDDYTREKTADEIEMERPALTAQATSETPVGRRMAPGGELRVKTDPKLSTRVKMTNLIKDTSTCRVHIYKGGQKVNFDVSTEYMEENYSLVYKGERKQPLFGMQHKADEVRVMLDRGRMMVTVFQEYSSFDKVTRKQYYVLPPGQGVAGIKDRAINVTLTGDSPFADNTHIKLHAYEQNFVDGMEQKSTVEQIEFDLKNGEVKRLEYPVETKANYILIEIDDAGGIKLITEQP